MPTAINGSPRAALKRIYGRSSFAKNDAGARPSTYSTSLSDPYKIVENVSTFHDDLHLDRPCRPPIVPLVYLDALYPADTPIIWTSLTGMRHDLLVLSSSARTRTSKWAGRVLTLSDCAKFRGATGMPRVGSSLDPGRAAQPRAPSVVKTGGNMA